MNLTERKAQIQPTPAATSALNFLKKLSLSETLIELVLSPRFPKAVRTVSLWMILLTIFLTILSTSVGLIFSAIGFAIVTIMSSWVWHLAKRIDSYKSEGAHLES